MTDKTKPHTVWAVMSDWISDGTKHHSDVYIYATYEAAKESFDKIVSEDKELYTGYNNPEGTKYDFEEDTDYWCVWERNAYWENHSEVKIEEKIVEGDEELRGECKTFLIFNFETGDSSCPHWEVPIIIEGLFDVDEIEDSMSSYCDNPNYDEDATYEEQVEAVMSASDLTWTFVKNGSIPACDCVRTLWI